MSGNTIMYTTIPRESEEINVIINVERDNRSIIHGIVRDTKGRPLQDAVVKLFRTNDYEEDLKPITHIFTDEWGEFVFGPLTPGKKYAIKVWVLDMKGWEPEEEEEEYEESYEEIYGEVDIEAGESGLSDEWDEIEVEAHIENSPLNDISIYSSINSNVQDTSSNPGSSVHPASGNKVNSPPKNRSHKKKSKYKGRYNK